MPSTLRENVARESPQQSLFALPSERMLIQFAQHRRTHPQVYHALRDLAREAVRRGRRRMGIKALFEIARWNDRTIGRDSQGWKLNNSLTALYARALAEENDDLRDLFEFRALRSI